jgi:lactate dehydrogenase-like 2-hydroxyacid dehydrogenase
LSARPAILFGYDFRGRMREAFASRFDIVGVIARPDPQLVTADMATRARALVTMGSLGGGAPLFAALPNVKLLCCYGSGYEGVDLAAARAHGITVTHSPDANAPDVADMAMALLLSSTRRVLQADRYVRAGRWQSRMTRFGSVAGLTGGRLGILGLGGIGHRVAQRAAAFEMQIGYHNRRPRADVAWRYFDSLRALAEWADYLVVACRADDTNRHLVDGAILTALGPRGHLVNVARGTVVDEAALADALANGVIEGAALDVFEHEPAVHPKLLTLENVVLTTHLGAGTERSVTAMTELVIRNLEAHFAGRPVLTPVPMSND